VPVRGEAAAGIRRAFVAPPGRLLLSADYSQIELRLLAHLSGERALLDAFARGGDVHALTAQVGRRSHGAAAAVCPRWRTPASVLRPRLRLQRLRSACAVRRAHTRAAPRPPAAQMLLGKGGGAVSPAERRLGKLVNFGVVYGMGARALAQAAGVDLGAARSFLAAYQRLYPSAFEFMERCKLQAVVQGSVAVRRRQGPGRPGGSAAPPLLPPLVPPPAPANWASHSPGGGGAPAS
jgi:DNA polymerase-1